MCDCTVLDMNSIVIKQVEKERALGLCYRHSQDELPIFIDEQIEDTPPLKFTFAQFS